MCTYTLENHSSVRDTPMLKTTMHENTMHELIQSYFDSLYGSLAIEVKKSMFAKDNEIYGELYYYSVVELLKHLNISEKDNFLDIGSGLGKLIFQIFLTTKAASVTGIEINHQRYVISDCIKIKLEEQLPEFFKSQRSLNLIEADFLTYDFSDHHLNDITIAYVCGTVFSFSLLTNIGEKINRMNTVEKIVSLRKLPKLDNFAFAKRIFLHGTWDKTACYIYTRTSPTPLL